MQPDGTSCLDFDDNLLVDDEIDPRRRGDASPATLIGIVTCCRTEDPPLRNSATKPAS